MLRIVPLKYRLYSSELIFSFSILFTIPDLSVTWTILVGHYEIFLLQNGNDELNVRNTVRNAYYLH